MTVESLGTAVRVPGTLTWDLTQETVVSARMEGLITHVQVKAPFTEVRRGQALATVQAPAWNAAIAEAHALSQAQSASARELQGAAQQRLRSLGVPSGASARNGVVLGADHSGVVTEILVREGQTVMPGTPLFKINGLDTLWLEASVPQAALGTLRPGTSVQATV
ncbi:efflux RND transporter periplasmic adaptor subunit, partial [Xanthomonas perforans]